MTPFGQLDTEEKIALHRAFYNGQPIESFDHTSRWVIKPDGMFYPDVVYRIKVVLPKDIEVPWSAFQPNIQWAARNEDGEVFIYEDQPRLFEGRCNWGPMGDFYARINPKYFAFSPGDKPWNESLIKRPEGV